MSQTLNINYDPYAPGTFALTFTVNGVAPNLSTGYTATMRIWRSGLPTTAAPDVTVTSPSAIALGTSGSIVLDLVVIHTALALVSTTGAVWTYDLIVTPTGAYSQKVCSGQLAEGVGSDQTADVTAPISVNWAGTVGGDLSGTLPNPTVDGLQGRAVAATAPTNGQVLAWNSTASQWEPTAASAGSGTVTSITAGTGLTGGTITTSGTIAADIGTGATQVAAGNHDHTLAGDVQGLTGATVVHKVHTYNMQSGAPTDLDVWSYQGSSSTWHHRTLSQAGIAAEVHAHGNITSGGAIGSTDGLVVKTGTSGAVETLALPAGKSVLTSTSSAGSLAWELASGLAGLVTINEQTYTANGTFTKSANCKYVVFEMCGGGGGGGNGTAGGSAGAGGCGGLYQTGVIMSADLGTTTSITIGSGGGAATDGSATVITNDTTSTILAQVSGGRGAAGNPTTIIGIVATNGFQGGGNVNAGAGKHGGYGPGGGGAGSHTNTTAGAGGRPCSMLIATGGTTSATGGGAAGGTTLNNGNNATVTIRGFGEGAGGGGGSTGAGTAGNGGVGLRGSGGGGGGATTTTGGTGGAGGNGFVRIIEVQVA